MSALLRLEMLGRIAEGGMAEIFLANWTSIEGFTKPVAVKRLHPELERHIDLVEAFVNEAKITARFCQSNLVSTIYFDRIDGRHALLMDYIAGASLASLLPEKLSLSMAVLIGIGILRGLDFAHRLTDVRGEPLGIVHRDISPDNVLVSKEGEVKIVDFGIALHRSKRIITRRGVVKGKMTYLSPEQASGRPVEAPSDQFSAALVIDELIRGAPFYRGDNDTAILKLAQQAAYRPPPDSPPALSEILCVALSPLAVDRFASAGAFADALQAWACAAGLLLSGRELACRVERSGSTPIIPATAVNRSSRKTKGR